MPAIAGRPFVRISKLGLCWDAIEQHFAILDDLVGEVLSNVNVLGELPTTDYVVSALGTRFVALSSTRVWETFGQSPAAQGASRDIAHHSLQTTLSSTQPLSGQSRSLLHLPSPHHWGLVVKQKVDVDSLEELFPQSESAYPESKSWKCLTLCQYVILKLGMPSSLPLNILHQTMLCCPVG